MITVAQLKAQFTADTSDLESGVNRAARTTNKAASDINAAGGRAEGAFSGVTAKAVALGNVLSSAVMGGVGLLAQGFSSAITAGASFGETLNRIQAVGGASADQLSVINAKALELGAKLPISAQQAADGMLALVSGGMTVENALVAVEGVSAFAAAQMLQVGDAAEIVSASLTSFGLGADKASYAADVMSQVANSSAASVQDWGESIKYVGPVAGALKQPIEDMGVAIGLMANQSIKGSSAGTALRTMLTNLAAPSDAVKATMQQMGVQITNASGQMLPFISIAEQMRSKMTGMTDVQKANIAEMIAGKEGMSGFLAIVGAAPAEFDKMKQSMANAQGATEEFAKATNKGFAFEWGQLQGSIETVLIQGFQAVEPVLSAVTASATGLVNVIGGGMTQVGPIIQGIVPYVTALSNAFSSLMSGGDPFGDIADTLSEFGVISEGTAETIYGLGTAFDYAKWAAISLANSDLAGFVANLGAAFGMGENEANAFAETVVAVLAPLGAFASQIASVVQGVLASAFQAAGQIAQVVLGGLPALFQAVAGPAQSIASAVGSYLVSAFQSVGTIAQSVFAGLPGLAQTVMAVYTAFASFIYGTLASAFQVILPIAASVFQGIATVVQFALPGVFALANAIGSLLVAAFGVLQSIAVSVFSTIQPYIPTIQSYIAALAVVVGSMLGAAFNWLAGVVTGTVIPALQTAGAWLAQNLPGAIQVVMNFIVGTLLPGLMTLAGWLANAIPAAIALLSSVWQNVLLPAIQTVAGWVTGTLFPLFGQLVNWLSAQIPAALAALSNFWQQHGDQIISIAQTTWQIIQSAIDTALAAIATVWKAWTQTQEGDWRGFGETLRSIWDGAWEAIKGAIAAAVPVIIQTVTGLVTSAKEQFTSVDWGEIGRNIIAGIGDGISSMASSLAEKAARVAQAAKEAIEGFFDMHSPSRVMAETGSLVVQGLAIGMADALPGLITQVVGGLKNVVLKINDALKGIGAIENERFEQFRDAVSALADGFDALLSIGDALAGGKLATITAATEQIKTLVTTAKTLLTGIDLKGIGAISNEKFEQWRDALGALADGMASIASIGASFGGNAGIPDLSGLSSGIRGLAIQARQLLVDIDSAIEPINASLPEKLQTLADGAKAASALIDSAMTSLRLMLEFAGDTTLLAITASVGARQWFASLGAALAQFVEDSLEALETYDVGVSQQLVSRAALLASGAAAEKDIIASAITSITALLKYATDATLLAIAQSVGARAWFARLGAALAQFVEDVLEAFDTYDVNVSQILVNRAAMLNSGAASVQPLIGSAITSIASLMAAASNAALMAIVTSQAARANLANLGAALAQFVEDLLEALVTFDVNVSQDVINRASRLGEGADAVNAVISGAFKAVQDLIEAKSINLSGLNRSMLVFAFEQLVIFGMQLVEAVNRVIGEWTAEVKPSVAVLGTVLQDALAGLTATLDLTAAILEGRGGSGTIGGNIPTGRFGLGFTTPEQILWDLLQVGMRLVAAANAAIGTWSAEVKPALATIGRTLQDALSGLTTTQELWGAITSGGPTPGLGNIPTGRFGFGVTTPEQIVYDWIQLGVRLANAALLAIGKWDKEVKPGLKNLGPVLSAALQPLDEIQKLFAALNTNALDTSETVVSMLAARLYALVAAGVRLAVAANAAIGAVRIKIKDSLTNLGTVLKDAFAVADNVLDLNKLLGGQTFPPINVDLIVGRITAVVEAGELIAKAANDAIGKAIIKVKPSLENLGKVLDETFGIVSSVLDFNKLLSTLLNFRGLDMGVVGPKIDLIFAAAIAIAQEFGRRAEGAGIKEAWQEAGAALSDLFGNAASTLKDALDLGGTLLDPDTQIPSIGQIQGKVNALFNIITAVATQFAAKAEQLAASGVDAELAGKFGEQVKGVFEGIREVAAAISDFTGVSLGASGFNNIAQVLDVVFALFDRVRLQAGMVNEVSAAIASVLGGLANLLQAETFSAGVSIGQSIAAGIAQGITNGAGTIAAAIAGAVTGQTGGANTGGASVQGGTPNSGGTVINNITNNNQRTLTVQIVNVSGSGGGPSGGNLSTILSLY